MTLFGPGVNAVTMAKVEISVELSINLVKIRETKGVETKIMTLFGPLFQIFFTIKGKRGDRVTPV